MKEKLEANYQLQLKQYQKIWEVTDQLTVKLKEDQVDEILGLVEKRESLIQELKALVEQEDALKQNLPEIGSKATDLKAQIKALIKNILERDSLNKAAMEKQKSRLQGELIRLNKVKKAKHGYDQTYSPDALYFDKLK